MASEHKLDMILRRMEEFERRRVEAEQTRRADFQSLKAALASWIPHVQNNTEDSHFLVGNKQYKMTPTMCSTECFSPNVEPNLAVDVVVTCATTSMTSVDLVSAEDAIGATYIYNPVQPMVTPAKCLTNCSNPNNIPDLTVAAVVTCTSTSLASMDLEVGKDVACTTEIDGPDCHKETHTKCSMLGLDVKGGADHVGGAFLIMSGVAKSVPISIESIDIFSASVQKCYPQSILFMHNGWSFGGLLDWNSKQYKNSMLIVNPLEQMQVLLVPLVWDPDAEMGQIVSYALQPENCQLTTCMRAHCIKPSDYEIITAKENHAADAPRLLIDVMEDEGNTVWTLEFSVSGVVQKKRDLWLCAFAVNKDMKVVMFLQQYGYANLVIVNLLSVPWDPGGSHLALAIKQGTRLSLWAITSIGWLCFLWSYWLHYKRNSNRGDQVGEACIASSHRLGDKPNFKGRRMLGAMWAAIWAGLATFQEVQASPRGNHI
uniref:Uncharacterized protein n=1 Tax=Oryza barthii TaxID=65489 RepID=A0A0D3HWD4_9ORYZ